MLTVGITGGIGSGKSTVCKFFELLGVSVFYADTEAKKIISTDTHVIKSIKSAFGKTIYKKNNELNRIKLSHIVFNDAKALEKLNKITHPVVKLHFLNWKEKQDCKYIIKEAALMYESGSYRLVDKMIVVYAPEKIRIQRIAERDKKTKEDIKAVIKNQISEQEKVQKADYVIYNEEKRLVLPQVLKLHEVFMKT